MPTKLEKLSALQTATNCLNRTAEGKFVADQEKYDAAQSVVLKDLEKISTHRHLVHRVATRLGISNAIPKSLQAALLLLVESDPDNYTTDSVTKKRTFKLDTAEDFKKALANQALTLLNKHPNLSSRGINLLKKNAESINKNIDGNSCFDEILKDSGITVSLKKDAMISEESRPAKATKSSSNEYITRIQNDYLTKETLSTAVDQLVNGSESILNGKRKEYFESLFTNPAMLRRLEAKDIFRLASSFRSTRPALPNLAYADWGLYSEEPCPAMLIDASLQRISEQVAKNYTSSDWIIQHHAGITIDTDLSEKRQELGEKRLELTNIFTNYQHIRARLNEELNTLVLPLPSTDTAANEENSVLKNLVNENDKLAKELLYAIASNQIASHIANLEPSETNYLPFATARPDASRGRLTAVYANEEMVKANHTGKENEAYFFDLFLREEAFSPVFCSIIREEVDKSNLNEIRRTNVDTLQTVYTRPTQLGKKPAQLSLDIGLSAASDKNEKARKKHR